PIHPTPPPRATTFHTAPRPARVARRTVVWGGVVLRNVVARGGWVDVGGPCGCQASRRTLHARLPQMCQGQSRPFCATIRYSCKQWTESLSAIAPEPVDAH